MNSFSGQSYCNDSNKAIINYRTYQASKIIYQYPNGTPQEIKSQNCGNLTYQLTESNPETCNDAIYRITYQITNAVSDNGYRFYRPGGYWGYPCGYNNKSGARGSFWGRILDFRFTEPFVVDACIGINNTGYAPRGVVSGYKNLEVLCHGRWGEPRLEEPEWFKVYGNPGDTRLVLNNETISWEIELVREFNCPPECKFEVFEEGNLIHEETKEECPIVEVYPSQLSDDVREIFVNKQAGIETVRVVNYGMSIDGRLSPPVGTINIPDSCLNIYVINNLFNSENSSTFNSTPIRFVGQICSDKGCPPPDIEVICEQIECPPNTCTVRCNGRICCYDRNGISVFSFPQ